MKQFKITKQKTNQDYFPMGMRLNEIGRTEMQSMHKTIDSESIIGKSSPDSIEELVKTHLKLVKLVAKYYQNQGLSLSDLINEGNFGLITAAEHFYKANGFSFTPFATWWIRQSILQAIRENSLIERILLDKIGPYSKVKKMFQKLEVEYQREPTYNEITEIMDLFPGIV